MSGAAVGAVEVAETIDAARRLSDRLRAGSTLGLVPTMGALHDGHLSLIDCARATSDAVLVSIFVNPLQFGAGEDLDRYPRTFETDLGRLRERGVDGVFAPTRKEMYPAGDPAVAVIPKRGAEGLCGAARPGHFEGVLTVVAKLFGIIRPDVAVFGRKDLQQSVLIRAMVRDLDMPVRLEIAPTVRDDDGLALSSRNVYLADDERRRAAELPRALAAAQRAFAAGTTAVDELREAAMERLRAAGHEIEYLEIVDPDSLAPVGPRARPEAVCAAAVWVGTTRLIDNVSLGDPPILADSRA